MGGPRDALAHYADMDDAAVSPLGAGLINQTFAVDTAAGSWVLQRVSPIFDPAIHENIAAVTERIASCGMTTPLLTPTLDGRPCVRLQDGSVWRVMTRVDGTTFDKVQSTQQAHDAARLIGALHHALEGLEHRFVAMRTGVHDTPGHLANLERAVAAHPDHRLSEPVRALAEAIHASAEQLSLPASLPKMIGHGDLKFNNLLFEGPSEPESDVAVAVIDLDTVGPIELAHELGDMWRSWCNRAGEDATAAAFDLAVLASSWDGYQIGLGRTPGREQRRALLAGVEQISLELAARFAADALQESFFGYDTDRFPAAGEHNLVRATGQHQLHGAVAATRPERAKILGL